MVESIHHKSSFTRLKDATRTNEQIMNKSSVLQSDATRSSFKEVLPMTSNQTPVHSGRGPDQLFSEFYSAHDNIHRPALLLSSANLPLQPNVRVKKPFKHGANKTDSRTVTQTFIVPVQTLMDKTSMAVNMFSQVFMEQKPPRIVHVQRRLLKARLKPLEPVQASVPTIHQCRGIVAETRTYSACSSRTFQRLKTILSNTDTPKEKMWNKESVSISESVHRTSEASYPESTLNLSCSPDDDLTLKMDVKEPWETASNDCDVMTEVSSQAGMSVSSESLPDPENVQ